jgi:hypothetical protein
MVETPEVPEAAPETPPETPAAPAPERRWRRRVLILLVMIIAVPVLIFSLWTWVTLGYVYSSGYRTGYIQKLSKKGWLCKTWEGELAMIPPPGTVTPQIFSFTVRSDSIANFLLQDLGKRVTLTYEEHRGIPTSCFGDTDYFVSNVRILPP